MRRTVRTSESQMALRHPLLALCPQWSILYLNYIGVVVLSLFTRTVWEMYTEKDVTDKHVANAGRFSGNMFEQSPIFLTSLWMYTIFADYETGWTLGVLYLVGMTYYPFHYMIFRQFTFWFENCTQMRYGVNGIFILGALCQASKMNWAAWLNSNPVGAGILGFMVGSFAFVPGLPLAPLYTFLHYKFDHAAAVKAQTTVVGSGQQDNA